MATRHGGKLRETWPKRGEIHLATLDPTVGHEIKKTRPVLIIQNDVANEYGQTTIVAPITSTVRMPLSPVHTLLAADATTGLTAVSVALLNQIRTLDRRRLVKRLGAVNAQTMQQVNEAIRISLDVGV